MSFGEAYVPFLVPPHEPTSDEEIVIELSEDALHEALCDVALEELEIARGRYARHGDPVRCAVGISLILRTLAKELYSAKRIELLHGIGWLNFLLRTSRSGMFEPHVIETMSAALYGDPEQTALPSSCDFWFEAAEAWIGYQNEIARRQC